MLTSYAFSLAHRIDQLGLPALALAYDDKVRTIGAGEAAAVLRADRHELVRVLAARRTEAQIDALDWTGDPGPFLAILPEYGPTTVLGVD